MTFCSLPRLFPKRSVRTMVERSNGDPMVACYIDSSFPALLHFAYKYADSPERAVLANANAGGENVARGSLLGALMGAAETAVRAIDCGSVTVGGGRRCAARR